jgi:hypothetical protein
MGLNFAKKQPDTQQKVFFINSEENRALWAVNPIPLLKYEITKNIQDQVGVLISNLGIKTDFSSREVYFLEFSNVLFFH